MLIRPAQVKRPERWGPVGMSTMHTVISPYRNMEVFSSTISILSTSFFWEIEKPAAPMPARTKASSVTACVVRKICGEAPFQDTTPMPETQSAVPASIRAEKRSLRKSAENTRMTTVCTGQTRIPP